MVEEIWKDIEEYKGRYQVSNLGRVRSLDRISVQHKHFGDVFRPIKGKIMSNTIGKRGYAYVHLCNENNARNNSIHRLVAQAFIPNPNNLPCINHKDENKTNNNVENLEWCTYSYNNSYGTHSERISLANKGKHRSAEARKKYSEARKGKHLSEETKKKLSKMNKGEKNPNYGLKRSQETLEKMRLARMGFRQTESARQKLREAALAQWQRKRQLQQEG